jgi:hypothetical protein
MVGCKCVWLRIQSNSWNLKTSNMRGKYCVTGTRSWRGVLNSKCFPRENGKWLWLFIYLLTYSMVQSPSWADDWLAASQEILRISRKPKVHYRTHKRTPPVPILGQPNPAHMPTSHLLEIHPNIIHPSTPRSPQWSLSLRILISYKIKW